MNKNPFEETLTDMYSKPIPRTSILNRIENLIRSSPLPGFPQDGLIRIPRWLYAFIFLLILITAVVFTVGPQKVWAAVMNISGYIPGYGFVKTDGARILVEPVEIHQNGLTVKIEHFLAATDQISLVITGQGFPEYAARFSDNISLHMPNGTEAVPLTSGTNYFNLGSLKMTSTYRPLKNIPDQIIIVWRFMLTPQDKDYQRLEIPLNLSLVNAKELAQKYPPAYQPAAAIDNKHGIWIEVMNVASTLETTALQVAITSSYDKGEVWINSKNVRLVDNLGNTYLAGEEIPFSDNPIQEETVTAPGATSGEYIRRRYTLEFPRIDPKSASYVLNIDGLSTFVFPIIHIPVDLGNNPKIGTEYPLNSIISAAGYEIPIQKAQIVAVENRYGDTVPALVIIPGMLPAGLTSIEQIGVTVNSMMEQVYDPSSTVYAAVWPSGQFPIGKIELVIDRLEILLSDQWQIEWRAP